MPVISHKQHQLLPKGGCWKKDMCLHISQLMTATTKGLSVAVLLHLTNHTQSDYPLSIHLKVASNKIHFRNEKVVQCAVQNWLLKQQKKEFP